MKKLFLILIVAAFSTSCARHIKVVYQTDTVNTGAVKLKPTKPTSKTLVTVNNNLLVDSKNAKSVTIKNVPSGTHKIVYSSESSWYKENLNQQIDVELQPGQINTQIVQVPPYSTGYWIYTVGSSLGSTALLIALLLL